MAGRPAITAVAGGSRSVAQTILMRLAALTSCGASSTGRVASDPLRRTVRSAAQQSQDRATRRDLKGGNTPAVHGDQPVAVLAAKHARVRGQRRDGVVNGLLRLDGVGLDVGDISVVAANESDA